MCFYIKFNETSEKKDRANAFPLYYFGLTFQGRSTLISQFRFPTPISTPLPGMTTWRRVKVSRDASQRDHDHKGTGLVVIFADNIDQSCQTLAL